MRRHRRDLAAVGSVGDSNVSGDVAGGCCGVVPLLAKGWSHPAGETHLKGGPMLLAGHNNCSPTFNRLERRTPIKGSL